MIYLFSLQEHPATTSTSEHNDDVNGATGQVRIRHEMVRAVRKANHQSKINYTCPVVGCGKVTRNNARHVYCCHTPHSWPAARRKAHARQIMMLGRAEKYKSEGRICAECPYPDCKAVMAATTMSRHVKAKHGQGLRTLLRQQKDDTILKTLFVGSGSSSSSSNGSSATSTVTNEANVWGNDGLLSQTSTAELCTTTETVSSSTPDNDVVSLTAPTQGDVACSSQDSSSGYSPCSVIIRDFKGDANAKLHDSVKQLLPEFFQHLLVVCNRRPKLAKTQVDQVRRCLVRTRQFWKQPMNTILRNWHALNMKDGAFHQLPYARNESESSDDDTDNNNSNNSKSREFVAAPGTKDSYVGSLYLFLEYLQYIETYDQKFIDKAQRLNKIWRESWRSERSVRRHKVSQKSLENLLTANELHTYPSSPAATQSVELLRELENSDGKVDLTAKQEVNIRSYLHSRLLLTNAQRTGCITNMTVKEFEKAKVLQDPFHGYRIDIWAHKTVSTYGAAQLHIELPLHQEMNVYLRHVRPRIAARRKPEKKEFFLSVSGDKLTGSAISKSLREHWELNGKKNVSATLIRKSLTTIVSVSTNKCLIFKDCVFSCIL